MRSSAPWKNCANLTCAVWPSRLAGDLAREELCHLAPTPRCRFGVRSGMPMAQAVRLHPQLRIVSGRHGAYGETSERVMQRLRDVTPGFEQISIDEAFLDITGMREPAEMLARRLQAGIRDDLGLPSSIGIASNKLVAKIATEVGKKAGRGDGPPFGLTIVPRGEERNFLAPLPMEMLWGVGPKTGRRLATLGIRTIGDIARWPEASLVAASANTVVSFVAGHAGKMTEWSSLSTKRSQ